MSLIKNFKSPNYVTYNPEKIEIMRKNKYYICWPKKVKCNKKVKIYYDGKELKGCGITTPNITLFGKIKLIVNIFIQAFKRAYNIEKIYRTSFLIDENLIDKQRENK